MGGENGGKTRGAQSLWQRRSGVRGFNPSPTCREAWPVLGLRGLVEDHSVALHVVVIRREATAGVLSGAISKCKFENYYLKTEILKTSKMKIESNINRFIKIYLKECSDSSVRQRILTVYSNAPSPTFIQWREENTSLKRKKILNLKNHQTRIHSQRQEQKKITERKTNSHKTSAENTTT